MHDPNQPATAVSQPLPACADSSPGTLVEPAEIPFAKAAVGPQVVDYDRFGSTDSQLTSSSMWMVGLVILSGCCVVSALAGMTGTLWAVVHALIVLATMALAIISEVRVPSTHGARSMHRCLDIIAGLGLLGIGLAPLMILGFSPQKQALPAIGICFLFLAGSAYRHRLQYVRLAEWAQQNGGQSLPRRLRRLGVWKWLYETLWLGCCGVTPLGIYLTEEAYWLIPAFACLLGCAGFGIIWIIMLLYHTRLISLVSRSGVR